MKLVAGWRVDNNHVSQVSGFGTVFTPRLGVIYTPRGFVTKANYAEGFKDPSNLEKFTRLPGVLDPPDPNRPLEPERARNVELSVGRQWGRRRRRRGLLHDLQQSGYARAAPARFGPRDRADLNGLIDRLGGKTARPQTFDQYFDFSEAIANALPDTVRNLSAAVIRKLFDDPLFVQRFENAGALRVRGVQANASFSYGSTDLFGNYTYTNPIRTKATREVRAPGRFESDRLGDIASHHLNLGVQHRWRKFDLGAA